MIRAGGMLGLLVTLGAVALAGQTQHHPCEFCHDLHGGSATALTVNPTTDALCLSCHGDAGPAFVNRNGVQVAVPKNVAIHNGTKHTAPTNCWGCHDHEGEAGSNLKMIPARRTGTASGSTRSIAFTAFSGARSFADGDATYDGVCEVCHAVTTQHRFDGSAGKHYAATDCRACHKHVQGFKGDARCTLCHSQTQGARRAVVSEFGRTSHHVNWQAAGYAAADSIPDADCAKCHDQTQHQQGRVRLWSADAPSDSSRSIVLAGDANTTATEAAKLEPVCLSCHDANGAAGATAPFSDGVTRPLIDSAAWVASAHSTSANVPAGCYGDGITGCHATGHGSQKRDLLAPAATAAASPLYSAEQEGFCYTCHDGAPAAKNIQAEFLKGTNTATIIYHHPVQNDQQPAGRPVECTSCHNPHVAKSDATAPVPPAASGRLLGVDRVSVTNGAAGTVPTYAYRQSTDATPALEYEICFKCHSSYTPVPTGKTNMAVAFNPANPSYHPVEGAGKNLNINANAFVNGWLPTQAMHCSDCHSSDNPAVLGPHGSNNRYILKKPYTASSASRTMSSGESCFDCHRYDTYANEGTTSTIKAYSRFNPPGIDKGHTFHVGDRRYPCYACHTTHGSATQSALIVTGRSPGITSYTRTANGGTCTPTCHGSQSYTISYPR